MPKYEFTYNLRGQVIIDAPSYEKAKKYFWDSDGISTEELVEGVRGNIADLGNDAIELLDIVEE